MGKGDKRSARGKRVIGSSGVSRQKKKVKYVAPVEEKKATKSPASTSAKVTADTKKKAAPKKAAPKKEAVKKAAEKKPAAKKEAPKKAAAKKEK